MGIFSNLVSGAIGAGIASLIKDQGGIQAIASKFEQNGLGNTVKSWIGTGSNLPISADQIQKVLGGTALGDIASKLGLSPEQASAQLAEHLPQAIDKMTPNGQIQEAA